MSATSTDVITPAGQQSLRSRLHGEVLTPAEPGYENARRAWNLSADHRPAAVVMAESLDDIRASVTFARDRGLGVGVLATGHGTGRVTDPGALLINTSHLRAVSVNPAARTARVSAGAIWSDVVIAAAANGLAGLAGSSTGVGVVGYTLGGGFGWLGRRYGLAAHSIREAEIVTADGRLVTAGPSENADLFWGLMGGTGNFGIVTALEFALYPVRQVYGGNLYYPLDRAGDVLTFFAEWSRSTPDELTAAASFRTFPPLPTVPEPLRGTSMVALRGCFCGEPAAGRKLVDQARAALGPAAVDTFGIMPVAELASISADPVDPLPAAGHAELLHDLTPETIDAAVDLAGPDSRSPLVMMEIRQLGGALAGPAGSLSPMAHSQATFSLNAIGVTSSPAAGTAVRAHLAKVAGTMRPHATGDSYVNFLDLDGATPERIRAAYSAPDWQRLMRLKSDRDPDNLFRFNRNISDPHDWAGSTETAHGSTTTSTTEREPVS